MTNPTTTTNRAQIFVDMIADWNLHQLITDLTGGNAIFYLIWVSDEDNIEELVLKTNFESNDHELI